MYDASRTLYAQVTEALTSHLTADPMAAQKQPIGGMNVQTLYVQVTISYKLYV